MFNLGWLRTFCTLVDTGHFTRTAEKLAMTQPGVSQHIRKLEQYYDKPLIDRNGKQFSLTEAGVQVYQSGREILASLSKLDQQLGEESPHVGLVMVGSPASVGLKLYPELLDLQVEYQELIIDYHFADNAGIEQRLLDRQLDIGLMTSASGDSELLSTLIDDEPLLLATPPEIDELSWDVLLSLGYIDHPDGESHATLLLQENFDEFENFDQLPHQGFVNQVSQILEPISRGLGFTILPAYTINARLREYKVKIHRLARPASQPLYLVRRRHRHLPLRIQFIISHIEGLL